VHYRDNSAEVGALHTGIRDGANPRAGVEPDAQADDIEQR
jgi:hypothetical protein